MLDLNNELAERFDYLKKNPSAFMEEICGVKLSAWQRYILDNISKFNPAPRKPMRRWNFYLELCWNYSRMNDGEYVLIAREYFLNTLRNIVRMDDGYCLQKVYEEDKNGKIIQTEEGKNNLNKDSKECQRCLYYRCKICLMRSKLEDCPENQFVPYHYTAKCDAYSPVFPLNIIKTEEEMINFIEKVKVMFGCVEDFEWYFGFERKYDEVADEFLETVREYYDRGGSFTRIPDKYPCVIYFGVVDFDGERAVDEKLDWIYIGE